MRPTDGEGGGGDGYQRQIGGASRVDDGQYINYGADVVGGRGGDDGGRGGGGGRLRMPLRRRPDDVNVTSLYPADDAPPMSGQSQHQGQGRLRRTNIPSIYPRNGGDGTDGVGDYINFDN